MPSTLLRSVLTVFLIGATGLLVACGGDDGGSGSGGGGSGEGVSVEEFCSRIEALESAVAPDDMVAAVAAIEDLVDVAPTDEVRDALETLVPVLSRMSELDENDPDAIGELMNLAMDPKIMEASTVLEEFGAEQCGFPSEESGSADSVPEPAVDEGTDPALDVFEATTIREYVETAGSEYLNGGSIAAVSVSGAGMGYFVSVDATSPNGVAAVPMCELLVEFYETNAPGVDVTLEVMTEGLPAVTRQPGGVCES